MKLGLGTAQFGLSYGISNQNGQVLKGVIPDILHSAQHHQVGLLDTAAMYGSSEAVLGEVLQESFSAEASFCFDLITKTPHFNRARLTTLDAKALRQTFEKSLEKLHRSSLYGLLIHNSNDLLAPGGAYLFEAMQQLQADGKVQKIGISAYTPEQVEAVCAQFPVEILQIPINVFDQKFLKNGLLTQLKKANVEIHARSIFLQGLLLMDLDSIPAYFAPIYDHFIQYKKSLDVYNLSPIEAAVGFIQSVPEIDRAICGVTSVQELQEIAAAASTNFSAGSIDYSLFDLAENPAFADPCNWPNFKLASPAQVR